MRKFLILAVMVVLGGQLTFAKSTPSINAVIKSSFKNVSAIEAKSIILTTDQVKKIRKHAKASLDTKVYRYYDIMATSGTVGKGVLITRKVRSKKATILYAFDKKGTLRFSEIMRFDEPPEYIPSETWMSQLQEQKSSTALKVGKDIPTISGATLSALSLTEGARVARAIYETILKKR
jgi:electron transport complex protein RnfG